MSHHEGGEFVSRSPLPPLRHPELLKPPALLVSMSDLALSLCLTLFSCTFGVALYNLVSAVITVIFHIFFTIPTTFFICLSHYTGNTVLNSVSLSGIMIFILAISPFQRDAYLPWILNSSSFIKVSFCFSSVGWI